MSVCVIREIIELESRNIQFGIALIILVVIFNEEIINLRSLFQFESYKIYILYD